ncbi:MAG: Holliday junction resolvase RecU [Oscillospiraceae bacterium]|nr:Holliday junction resolvase RecU [Oscillospiraceae bacterium]
MKDFRQANRGKTFEGFLQFANNAYRREGTALIEKQYVEMLPIRDGRGKIVACKVGEKSTVDYIGRLHNHPIAIEAKNTKNAAIRFHAVEDHQARYLEEFTARGAGIGLVLVSFDLERYFAVPAIFWLAARKAWETARRKGNRKATPLTITAYGQTWTTTGKGSVRPEELLPDWECFRHHKYGLHYLENAEKYISTQQ